MKKAPEAFRTIGEVAELLDTPAHVLRFWESKFYQIKPVKRAGGRRYYRPDDLALIAGIRSLLQDRGMTIRGVQKLLQEEGVRHVAALAPPLAAEPADTQTQAPAAPQTEAAVTDGEQAAGAEVAAPDTVTPFPAPPRRQPSPAAARPVAPPPFAPPAGAQQGEGIASAGDAAQHRPQQDTASPEQGELAARHRATAAKAVPEDRPAQDMPARSRGPGPGASDADFADTDPQDAMEPVRSERPAQILRRMERGSLGARADRLAILASRIDRLLDRMSEASGAGRW